MRDSIRRLMLAPALQRALRTDAVRRRLPYVVGRRIALSGEIDVSRPNMRFMYCTEPRDGIGRLIYWHRSPGFEAETLSVFAQLASDARLVVDVGCHTGVFALTALASNPNCRVMAYEPLQELAALASASIALNGWEARSEVHEAAVTTEVGHTSFHVPRSRSGLALSASVGDSPYLGETGVTVRVPATTLDYEFAERNDVDLIKIDVEGHELSVLLGGAAVISRCRPTVIFECNPGSDTEELERFFGELDYELCALLPAGPKRVARLVPDEQLIHRNFLARPHGHE